MAARDGMRSQTKQRRVFMAISLAVLTVLALAFLFPTLWMIFNSCYDSTQATAYPPKFIPDPWTLRGYRNLLTTSGNANVFSYFKNSAVVTVLCIIGTMVSASLTAFGFAKLKSRYKNMLFFIVLSTMMIPTTVTLIPLYNVYSKIGFIDTLYPLVLPSFFGGGAFSIFLLRQFFAAIPKELSESAIIDGCSWFGIFSRVVLPNAKPALTVVLINTFVYCWNDYFIPMIMLSSKDKYTVAIGLTFSKDMYGNIIDTGPMMALATLSILPILILYLLGQKAFIEGVVTTGIKG
jgi:multiple sugar transport system permease protein